MEHILGYEQVKSKILPILQRSIGGQFILLEGMAMLGKCLMAQRLIQEWSGHGALIIEPENRKSGYSIEQLRDLSKQIQEIGLIHERMGYILDDMHLLSAACCHTLLKTLEELPSGVMLIGIALKNPPVIDTLRSRALKVSVNPCNDEQLIQWIAKRGLQLERTQLELLLKFSEGCPGQVNVFLSAPFQERLTRYMAFANAITHAQAVSALTNLETWEKEGNQTLLATQIFSELSKVVAILCDLRSYPWSIYGQWLQAIDEAMLLLQRSTRLSHVLEVFWLQINKIGIRPIQSTH